MFGHRAEKTAAISIIEMAGLNEKHYKVIGFVKRSGCRRCSQVGVILPIGSRPARRK
jgi:hypothetical protein